MKPKELNHVDESKLSDGDCIEIGTNGRYGAVYDGKQWHFLDHKRGFFEISKAGYVNYLVDTPIKD